MTVSSSPAPIAVFAYNRISHFKLMLESLRACHGFSESPVTIFIDGPKGEHDLPAVEQVRAYARSLNLPNVEILAREKNLGLKTSIYLGVGELCKRHGRVIVLEDDLVLSPVALDYFNAALEKYKDNPKVWNVVGYQYDAPALRHADRALVLPYSYTWGWATWERAWSQYDMNAPIDPRDLASPTFAHAFDAGGVRDFRNILALALQDKVNCWFTPWYYKMFTERGVSIFPPQTYIANTGMMRGGTHSTVLNPYYHLVKPTAPTTRTFTLPDDLRIDYWAIDAIKASWDARVQRFTSHLGRFKRMLVG